MAYGSRLFGRDDPESEGADSTSLDHALVPDLELAMTSSEGKTPSRKATSGGPQPQADADARDGDSTDDPSFLRSVFAEVLTKTRRLLDDPKAGDLAALTSTILRGRNKVLDETADSYARAAKAECRAGCTSCCHLMVLGTPYEILSIARHLLETKTPAEIEAIRQRLQRVSQ